MRRNLVHAVFSFLRIIRIGAPRIEEAFKSVETTLPVGLVVIDPHPRFAQTCRVEGTMMCAPLNVALDQPRLFEHLDMLGDAVEREIEAPGDLQDGGTLLR